MAEFDRLSAICAAFLVFPYFMFLAILRDHYLTRSRGALRAQVLICRSVSFVPLYTTLIYIALVVPVLFEAIEPLVTIVEYYVLIHLFALIVVMLGGPVETVRIMNEDKNELCCRRNIPLIGKSWFPRNKLKFYRVVTEQIFVRMLYVRTTVTVLMVCCYYLNKYKYPGSHILKILHVLFSLISMFYILRAVSSIVNVYASVFKNLPDDFMGEFKIIVFKLSVVLMVVLKVVQQFLYQYGEGYQTYADSKKHENRKETTERAYCALMLIIFIFTSVMAFYSFRNPLHPPIIQYRNNWDLNVEDLSFWDFFMIVLHVNDSVSHRDIVFYPPTAAALEDGEDNNRLPVKAVIVDDSDNNPADIIREELGDKDIKTCYIPLSDKENVGVELVCQSQFESQIDLNN